MWRGGAEASCDRMLEYGDRSDGTCCSFVSNALHNDPLWKKQSALYHKHAVGMMESSKRVRELHSRIEDLKIHPSSLEEMKLLLKDFVELDAQVRPGFLADPGTKAKMLLSELVRVIGATTERTLDALQAEEGMLQAAGEAWPEDAQIAASLASTQRQIREVVAKSRHASMLSVCELMQEEDHVLDEAGAARLLEAKKWLQGQRLPADLEAAAIAAFGALWKRIDVALAAKDGFPEESFTLAAMGNLAELAGDDRNQLHADLAVLMAEKKLRGAMHAFTKAREDATQANGDGEWASAQKVTRCQLELAAARSRADGLEERRAAAATRLEVLLGESAAIIASTQAQHLGSIWSSIENNMDTISLLLGSEPSGEFMWSNGLDPALTWEELAKHIEERVMKLHIKDLVQARTVLAEDAVCEERRGARERVFRVGGWGRGVSGRGSMDVGVGGAGDDSGSRGGVKGV